MSVTDEAPSRPARTSKVARNAAIVVGVVLVALIALLATRGTSEPVESRIVGQAAPEIVGQTLDGETFDISRHRGEWVLVNFFATWCTPCLVEHPELVAFSEQHAGQPVELVSVAFDDQADEIREFFAEEGGDWPVLPADTGRIALEYGVTGVPETYVVHPSGMVVGRVEGATAASLNAIIDAQGGIEAATGGVQ
jgi:cytochrome c biogenesis protein CcmG/thiol:disulfide interchange protein DsbE